MPLEVNLIQFFYFRRALERKVIKSKINESLANNERLSLENTNTDEGVIPETSDCIYDSFSALLTNKFQYYHLQITAC